MCSIFAIKMKKLILFLTLIFFVSCIKTNSYEKEINYISKKYANNNYNKNFCFLIDYSKSSNTKRLFLIDMKSKETIKKFYVAHGRGSGQIKGVPQKFSNIENSNMSSLGIAVIKERGYSNYGINVKYVLEGLNYSNSNLRKRFIVIHSSNWITETPFKINNLIQSLGCPTISNKAMKEVDAFIQKQNNKNILIYTFN